MLSSENLVPFTKERFSLWLHLQKNVPSHYPEHYPAKEKMLRIVIWSIFLEPNWKPFFWLSYFYFFTQRFLILYLQVSLLAWLSGSPRPWPAWWSEGVPSSWSQFQSAATAIQPTNGPIWPVLFPIHTHWPTIAGWFVQWTSAGSQHWSSIRFRFFKKAQWSKIDNPVQKFN